VERLKGSSSINPSKVDDALHEMEEVSHIFTTIGLWLTYRQTTWRINFRLDLMQFPKTCTYRSEVILDKPMKMSLLLYLRMLGLLSDITDTYSESSKPSDRIWPRSVRMLQSQPPQQLRPKPRRNHMFQHLSSHPKWQVPDPTLLHPANKLRCPIQVDQCSSLPLLRLHQDLAQRAHL
jgi:hypothetical protein